MTGSGVLFVPDPDEVDIIIDFTIEYYPNRTVFVGHRLVGIVRKIYNCKPAVDKTCATTKMNPLPIRSPV